MSSDDSEEDDALDFIRKEHRDWRRGIDEWRKEVTHKLGILEGKQRIAVAVERALKAAKLEAEYRNHSDSGSWNGPALEALLIGALQRRKRLSSIPPPARWIAKVLDTAVGKAVTVATSLLFGALLHYLVTHWPH
jgi:hypothetical protein